MIFVTCLAICSMFNSILRDLFNESRHDGIVLDVNEASWLPSVGSLKPSNLSMPSEYSDEMPFISSRCSVDVS